MLYTYGLSYVHDVIKWEKADPEIRNVLLKSGRMVALAVGIVTCILTSQIVGRIFLDFTCCALPKCSGAQDHSSGTRDRGNPFLGPSMGTYRNVHV